MHTSIALDTKALKALIKESVREVLKEEWFGLWQSVIPEVNDAEQADIEKSSGVPEDYKRDDFVDMTDWLSDEG